MIGNDIVDLKFTAEHCNWKRKGFLDKVFTSEEQRIVLESKEPFNKVWLLWSMKESAYKIYVQRYQERFFDPKKIQCQLKTNSTATITIRGQEYTAQAMMNKNYIYTIAKETSNEAFISECFKIDGADYVDQHCRTYQKIVTYFTKKNKLPTSALEIKKNSIGVPKLYQESKPLAVSFSISHHGNYGAYAILNI